jgi:nucleoside phosphorylase
VTIGIIAALPVEAAAMSTLISDPVNVRVPGDPCGYRIGHLASTDPDRPHRVVLATMPEDNNRHAATTCANMLRSFPRLRGIILTGIAGGVPAPDDPERHVRLGDVVIATDGVVDIGHTRQGRGPAELRRPLGGLSMDLKRAANQLQELVVLDQALPWRELLEPARDRPMAVFARPSPDRDVLHRGGRRIPHPPPDRSHHRPAVPRVHFGLIASADMLLVNERLRNELAARHRVMAIEMEAAGVAAGASHHGVPWFVVRGIVDYCDAFKNDDWHRYASLVSAGCVRAVLAACPPFPVWRTTAGGVSALLPEWTLDRLRALLRQATTVDPGEVWEAATDGLIPMPERSCTLAEMVLLLADRNAGPDGVPPLLALVEHVLVRVQQPLATQLRAWTDNEAEPRLGIGEPLRAYQSAVEEQRRKVPGRSAWRPPVQPCLLFQVERDGIDDELCQVKYWIQRRSQVWQPEPSSPRHTSFGEIERVLEEAIRHAESIWRGADEGDSMEIELLLPDDLLHLAIEWWRTELDSPAPTPLCLDYPVVVRSLDRMRAPHRQRVWHNRWHKLWQPPRAHRVFWGRGPGAADLAAWNAQLRRDRDVTTVVLGSSPENPDGGDELLSALNAGIPVILWDRRAQPSAEGATLFGRLLDGEPTELAPRVRALRMEAAELGVEARRRHPGHHLALLWDDPERNVYDASAGNGRSEGHA